jgi:hypothetical protein
MGARNAASRREFVVGGLERPWELQSSCGADYCGADAGRLSAARSDYTLRMAAKPRNRRKDDSGNESPDLVQMLAVYHVDLMAELEGLLRTLTKTQGQLERLRSGGGGGGLNHSQRREAVALLTGNLKTFAAKVDTLRDTLPEILKTAEGLEKQQSEAGDESETA